MKHWHFIAIGLGFYGLALVVTAPATLADTTLQSLSDGRLRLADAQGTVWSGSGQLLIRDAQGHIGVARPLVWQLRPGTLWRVRLIYEVGLGAGSQPFPVTVSWSRIALAHADIELPAATLGYVMPRLAPLELGGDLHLQVTNLLIGHSSMQGGATLQWRGASSALSPVSPLGDYELHLEGARGMMRATLTTLQGPLQLQGKGSWATDGPPAFTLSAKVPPEFRQRLEPFLQLIAVKQVDGSFVMQLQ